MGASNSKISSPLLSPARDLQELSADDIRTFVVGLGGKYQSYGTAITENAVDGELLVSLEDDAAFKETLECLDINNVLHQRVLLKEWRKATNRKHPTHDPHKIREIDLQTSKTEVTSDIESASTSSGKNMNNEKEDDTAGMLGPPEAVVEAIRALEFQEDEHDLTADSKQLKPFKKVASRALEDLKATFGAVNLVSLKSQGHTSLCTTLQSPESGDTIGMRIHADGVQDKSICRGIVLNSTDDFVNLDIPDELCKDYGFQEPARYYGHVVKCGDVRIGMVCVVVKESQVKNTTEDEKQVILTFLAAETERQLQRRKVLVQRNQNLRNDIENLKRLPELEDQELLPGYGPLDPVMASQVNARPNLFPYPPEEGFEVRRSVNLPFFSGNILATEAERIHLPPDFYGSSTEACLDRCPVGKHDMERVALLNSLGILDIEPSSAEAKSIISLVTMAGVLLGADFMALTLLDHMHQYFLCPTLCSDEKDIGKIREINTCLELVRKKPDGSPFLLKGDRCRAFCNYAVVSPEGQAFVVHDAAKDQSFASWRALDIGFASTAPIIIRGKAVGALCMLGKEPRLDFGKAQEVQQEQVAQLISQQLETWALHREMNQLEYERCMLVKNSGIRRPSQPENYAALVFTSVQGSTALWEADADSMSEALALHNQLMRQLIAAHCGYEVDTDGDTFHVAFTDVVDAVQFCLKAQERLNAAPWDESFLASPDACEDESGCFRGLRVRMAIHSGDVVASTNELSGRVEYGGETFHIAKSLATMGHGGQILVTSDVWNIASHLTDSDLGSPQVIDLGAHVMLTHSDKIHDGIIAKHVVQLVPASLAHDYLQSRRKSHEEEDDATVVASPEALQQGRVFPPVITKKQLSASFHDAPHANNTVTIACVYTAEVENLVADPSVLLAALAKSIGSVLSDLEPLSGYQCKEFMLAFGDVTDAIRFGLALQEYLEHNRVLGVWLAGLVKVGVHEGTFSAMGPHPTTGRADYFGKIVNRAACVANAAAFGSVTFGKEASDFDECNLMPVTNGYMLNFLGVTFFKGVRDEFALYRCLACNSWYDEVLSKQGTQRLPEYGGRMLPRFQS